MQSTKTIFWDWNGTLLNDTTTCIDAINILLKDRNLTLLDEKIYRDIFTFPVRDYYVKAGFNFEEEAFEKPAMEFIENYDEMVRTAGLFTDAEDALKAIRDKGYVQIILSAMQHDFLNELVREHGIDHYF